MIRYEIFQTKWNIESLLHEAEDHGYRLRVIALLKLCVVILGYIASDFESED